jgi:hypothetical protein
MFDDSRFRPYAVRMKITNRKTTVTLANDFKCGMVDINKGQVFDARDVREAGLVIITGHGMNEVVPHDCLGTYEESYNEVTDNGDVRTIKMVKADVTEIWVAHWKNLAEKNAADNLRAKKATLKKHIANVRATIEYVKKGEAEKELKNLLTELETLA